MFVFDFGDGICGEGLMIEDGDDSCNYQEVLLAIRLCCLKSQGQDVYVRHGLFARGIRFS